LISEIYLNVFNVDFSGNKLKFDNKIICNKLNLIIEFLGLCSKSYQNGFKTERAAFAFIKGSHYFNIDYFKNKRLIEYHKINPKINSFNYLRLKNISINKQDYDKIIEKHLLTKTENSYLLLIDDFNKYEFSKKYPTINFLKIQSVYTNSMLAFFKNH
jgi:hypothetical protein